MADIKKTASFVKFGDVNYPMDESGNIIGGPISIAPGETVELRSDGEMWTTAISGEHTHPIGYQTEMPFPSIPFIKWYNAGKEDYMAGYFEIIQNLHEGSEWSCRSPNFKKINEAEYWYCRGFDEQYNESNGIEP